jgi:DNA-binding IclR family transcriptional regulator
MVKETRTKAGKSYASPAVVQAGRILACLGGSSSTQMSLADISKKVGISGSKAFAIMEALQESGLVKRGKNGKGYSLGPGLVALSRKVLDDFPTELAVPVLERLTEELNSSTAFGVITGETVYIAATREAAVDIKVVMRVGHIMPLTYGAHGKAIAAFMPDEERDRVLKDDDLNLYGSPGNLDRNRLSRELELCRANGFACDCSELAPGINVVAAPILASSGRPVGFVEAFVLGSSETAVARGPVVADAGRALSRQLGAELE